MDIFSEARAHITSSLIEQTVPGGHWDGYSYVVRSPLRNDQTAGSFHVSIKDGTAVWHDFATNESGDFISLYAQIAGCTDKEAAEKIAGHKSENNVKKTQVKKAAPVIPVPESALSALNSLTRSDWMTSKHGT